MATRDYQEWLNAGKPWYSAYPVRDMRAQLIAAGVPASHLGTIGDYAHQVADIPEDHMPYSYTGWPVWNPRWWVCALDVKHAPDVAGGVDCNDLVAYWLAEARAGRMKWAKYIIWRATIYHVRDDWRPAPSHNHFDHVHLSTRTDHLTTQIGAWRALPTQQGGTVGQPFPFWPTLEQTINGTSGNAAKAADAAARAAADTAAIRGTLAGLQTAVDKLATAVGVIHGIDPTSLRVAVADGVREGLATAGVGEVGADAIADQVVNELVDTLAAGRDAQPPAQ